MANGYSIFVGLAVVVVFCAISWVAAPKGDTQTVWRSGLVMSAVACYLMWAITLLAQLHPLIRPMNNHLRPEFAP